MIPETVEAGENAVRGGSRRKSSVAARGPRSGPAWTQDAAHELRCRRLPRDSVLSPFLPSHAFFLRSLGPEASPTVACDPPARARASRHRLLPGRALCLLWPVWGHDKGAFHQRAW